MSDGLESAAQQSSALLQADEFFEGNPFAYFVVRSGGTIVKINKRFREISGFSSDEVAGKQIEDLLSRKDVSELYGYHREKLRYRDRPFEFECGLTKKSGEDIRAVITMNIVVQNGVGLGAIRDVTEERRLSAELKRTNDELTSSSARLRQAQEEVNRAAQLATLGEVSGRVAHEILNPLTAITAKVKGLEQSDAQLAEISAFLADAAAQLKSVAGAVETAETLHAIHEALDEQRGATMKSLGFVASELDRIQRLVDDMRGATKSAMARVKLSLFDLVQYCVDVMSDPVKRHGASMVVKCPDDLFVQADRGELIQVLTNLMRNGLEALVDNPSDVSRELSLTVTEADGLASIAISDNGSGVAPEIAPLIFEPNFTTKKSGTGLGLPIARRLIRAHGGDLQLTPVAGRGAAFLVTIPCEREKRAGWEG